MNDVEYQLTKIRMGRLKQKGREKNNLKVQQLNTRHQSCTQNCLLFQKFEPRKLRLLGKNIEFEENLNWEICFQIVIEIIKKTKAIRKSNQKKQLRIVRNLLPSKAMTFQSFQRLRKVVKQLKDQNFTNKAISGYLGCSKSQIQYIIKNNCEEQFEKSFFRISRKHINWLKIQLKESNLEIVMRLKNIYIEFLNKFSINQNALSITKFRTIIKQYVKGSYRLPIKRNIRASGKDLIDKRFNYAMFFVTQLQREAIYIFLDETSLGHNKRVPKIWQRRDELRIINFSQPTSSIGILGAISQDGYLAYQIVIGNVNGRVYAQHLIDLYKNIIQHYTEKDVIFILDNSKVHHCELVTKILRVINHKFLPPYTPQLNPIEKVWNCLKNNLNKPQLLEIGLYQQIHNFFNNIKEKQIKRTFLSIFPYLRKSLKREEF